MAWVADWEICVQSEIVLLICLPLDSDPPSPGDSSYCKESRSWPSNGGRNDESHSRLNVF